MSDDYYNLNGDPVSGNSAPESPSENSPYRNNPSGQNPYEQNPYSNGQNPYSYGAPSPDPGRAPKQGPNALAVTAFILSILSPLLCCCSTYGIVVSLVMSIAAIVLALLSKQKKPFHGLAIAALILGIVFTIVSAFLLLCIVIVFSSPVLMEQFQEMYNEMYNEMYRDFLQQGGNPIDLARFLFF